MAKKKQGGKTAQHKRPTGKRLGLKVGDGQKVSPGMILIRQVGSKIGLGQGVQMGRDQTVYATANGFVKFGKKLNKKIVSVLNNN